MTIATLTLFAMSGFLGLMMLILLIEGALLAKTLVTKRKRLMPHAVLASLVSNRQAFY